MSQLETINDWFAKRPITLPVCLVMVFVAIASLVLSQKEPERVKYATTSNAQGTQTYEVFIDGDIKTLTAVDLALYTASQLFEKEQEIKKLEQEITKANATIFEQNVTLQNNQTAQNQAVADQRQRDQVILNNEGVACEIAKLKLKPKG